MGSIGHTLTGSVAPFHHDFTVPCRQPDADPEIWFADPKKNAPDANEATRLCRKKCHRVTACLQWALATEQVDHGILGGVGFIERRRLLANIRARGPRPQRPPRVERQWGWSRSDRVNAVRIRQRLGAAQRYLIDVARGHGNQGRTATEFGLTKPTLAEAVAVVRHAPELLDDLMAGWVPWKQAYEYAQAVRRWTEQADAA